MEDFVLYVCIVEKLQIYCGDTTTNTCANRLFQSFLYDLNIAWCYVYTITEAGEKPYAVNVGYSLSRLEHLLKIQMT